MFLDLDVIYTILPQILMSYPNVEGGHIEEAGGENGLPIIHPVLRHSTDEHHRR